MPPAPAPPPPPPPPLPPPPAREITLDEWIAAGQSCCGADDANEPEA